MSAWYALKSFIQAQMKNAHFSITANFEEKYSEQISERFARNDFSRFFEACRNTFIHEGIPFAKIQINVGQVDMVRIMVDSDELRSSSYFESKGLPYIDGRQSIDFFSVCKRHYGEFIHTEIAPFEPYSYIPKPLQLDVYGRLSQPQKTEEDYKEELKEFIASTSGHGYYEFDVANLRPNECKWLSGGMLIKPCLLYTSPSPRD